MRMKVANPPDLQMPTRARQVPPRELHGFDESSRRWIERVIDLALEEDIGSGDITTSAMVPPGLAVEAGVWFKQDGILAGLPIFSAVFAKLDESVSIETLQQEGSFVEQGCLVARLRGPAASIVTGERLALNLLQRLCGVATTAHSFAALAAPYGIAILDTRKTTPGLRALERYAVRVGGGTNHRFGLFDAYLIKDNHIRLTGSVGKAARLARRANPDKRLQVEVTTAEELAEALQEGVDAVLLDNMTPQQVKAAVLQVAGKCFIEVSGGINQKNIRDYLIPGVKAISIGALTHSACSIDISLEIEA